MKCGAQPAVLSVLLSVPGAAQTNFVRNTCAKPYEARPVPQETFQNSPRLFELMRAGDVYLSLADAIALALENNLDIELQRYGAQVAEASILRARAGGLLRGVGRLTKRHGVNEAEFALLVADWDGGTRIGEALSAFLAVPRFAALSRSAALVVLSDGLERGDPTAMADAVARLARLCWRIIWLTPLAADPTFEARTAGLVAARPYLDRLADGSSIDRLHVELLGRIAERDTRLLTLAGLNGMLARRTEVVSYTHLTLPTIYSV